jgi:hypothetical protein
MADGVDGSIQAMEAPAADPVFDRLPSKTQAKELPVRHDPVLPVGQLGHPQVTRVDLFPLEGA